MHIRAALHSQTIPAFSLLLLLAACGGDQTSAPPTEAQNSDIAVTSSAAGVTPFIATVTLSGTSLTNLQSATFTIPAKTGATAKPVSARFGIDALIARGAMVAGGTTLRLPVFGLYAGQSNAVSISLTYRDGSIQGLLAPLTTAAYTDPNGIYDQATVVTPRDATRTLGFSYMYVKSALGSPVVIDTDGQIRWAATGIANSTTSAFADNGFIIGDQKSGTVYRQELDGTVTTLTPQSTDVANFAHNIDMGKLGLFADVDWIDSNGKDRIESTVDELTTSGTTLKRFDFAALISAYMTANGDDPSQFVRPGIDWMHVNASLYDPSDDSVIVSSRENFVMKVGYATGDIRWILGDPTKYWYQFPSLRAKALQLQAGDLYPIGQHALSLTSDGQLMLFNDGYASLNQPAGAPAGANRAYSAVSVYSIDPSTMSAHETWRFDHGQTILSPVCSSAYAGGGGTLLIDYASAENFAHMRLVGLDASHATAFEYMYRNPAGCQTGWNTTPIAFDDLQID
jgi:arylsulfate sulfotransferase